MARTSLPAIAAGESGLSRYLTEIRKFPMLAPDEEYMLAKRYKEHGDRGAATVWSPATSGSSPRSPWAIAAMACPSAKSSPRAMSADAGGETLRAGERLPARHLCEWWIKAAIQEYICARGAW